MSEPAVRPAPAKARPGGGTWAFALFVTGILALAFNLRGAVTSLPPVFPELASALHMSSLAVALLAATPVLCFGVFSIPAASLSRRLGEERVLLAALLLLAVGLLARGAWPGVMLFPGTVLAGAAIALMNVLLPSLVRVSRHMLAWQVMGFMGLQSLIYYSALSWLPILLRDRGAGAVHAGSLLALMNFGNAVTALVAPMLAQRARDQRWLIVATVTVSAVGLAGLWFAPLGGAAAWTLLFGLGQGAALGLAIYFTAARAPDAVTSASLSAFTQGGGYLVATAGPLVVGFLHSVTGSWTVPVLAMLVVIVFEGAVGWQAGRARALPAAARA